VTNYYGFRLARRPDELHYRGTTPTNGGLLQ
jgi:hypothetical protein